MIIEMKKEKFTDNCRWVSSSWQMMDMKTRTMILTGNADKNAILSHDSVTLFT